MRSTLPDSPCRMYSEFLSGVTLTFKLRVRRSQISLREIRETVWEFLFVWERGMLYGGQDLGSISCSWV